MEEEEKDRRSMWREGREGGRKGEKIKGGNEEMRFETEGKNEERKGQTEREVEEKENERLKDEI